MQQVKTKLKYQDLNYYVLTYHSFCDTKCIWKYIRPEGVGFLFKKVKGCNSANCVGNSDYDKFILWNPKDSDWSPYAPS